MAQIKVIIDAKGNSTILAVNILEDLHHDFMYFLQKAKEYSADTPETMFLHKRFLRAALLILFAYTEGVANRWLFSMLHQHNINSTFAKKQFRPLDEKIAYLGDLASGAAPELNVGSAKSVRNLLVHFKPGRDGNAFDDLSLPLVEETAEAIEKWISEMESSLGISRYPDTDQILDSVAENGRTTKEVSSGPNL